jgi:hypothetical protein
VVAVSVEHPSWCDRQRCTAEEFTGAHRSARAAVQGSDIAAWIHAPAIQPDDMSVVLDLFDRRLLPDVAHHFGLVLTSLAKATNPRLTPSTPE